MTIADKLSYLMGIKAAIKQALLDKGITVSDSDTFRSYAGKIDNIVTPSFTTLSVTPTNSQQTLTPAYPYNGFSEVNVGAVDNSIDGNIIPENIKAGITILGVLGTYTGQ